MKRTRKILLAAVLMSSVCGGAMAQKTSSTGAPYLLSQSVDMSQQFVQPTNTLFCADSLVSFDPSTGVGTLQWSRNEMHARQAFNTIGYWVTPLQNLDFPGPAYDQSPQLEFRVEPVNDRTVRVRFFTSPIIPKDDPDELMLVQKPAVDMSAWRCVKTDKGYTLTSGKGAIEIQQYPWRIIVRDAEGRELTRTRHLLDNDSTQVKTQPFSFIKRGDDNGRMIEPVFSLKPSERIYGCGESATSLNKAGQKLNLFVTDPQGPETPDMYKPIPFYFSNRGYGVFMHTAAPVTVDFGNSYIGSTRLFMADETADLFIMLGTPKEILGEYTALVGRPETPPLWSFGLWQSRISYFTEKEGRDVAKRLRDNKIPCDVIHFDTGWFETDWQCDYQFSHNFKDAQKMLSDLKKDGFHTCLWQLPYFTPKNRFFPEIIEKGMHVVNATGGMPVEDAILDFSNPATVSWYQSKIAGLLKQGVSTIKCDFGEAAPYNGFYHSGKGGLYEHNLYPLRYNKALWEEVERNYPGEGIIWARSAWAGSQRYALHWGGDAATTNIGLLGDLRGGLSFGLSGFSFWSHDMGGFVTASPEDIYRRWLPFGFLSSHTRAHGAPPTEPWLISESFTDAFRDCAEMKYKLMPYVYAQAKDCSERGLPMVRALLVEFPQDKGAWLVEDEYMFGSQILVAPLMESGTSRDVYLPKGKWIDYQTGKVYEGGYQTIEAGKIPAIILVRDGSLIPHVPLAQRTDEIDWNQIEWKAYKVDATTCSGMLFKPGDSQIEVIKR